MGVFSLCSNLAAIMVDADNKSYRAVGNCLVESATGRLVAGCKDSVLPQDGSIKAIGESAFAGCDIRSADIPEGVASIGDSAFSSCKELTSISIPSTVAEIGGCVFCGCKNLRKITVSSGNARYTDEGGCLINKQNKILVAGSMNSEIPADMVKNIGTSAFMGAEITNIVIPDGIEIIENEAFRDCASLVSVMLPKSLIAIGEDAFRGCSALKSVVYPGAPSMWQNIRIDSGNETLTNAKNGVPNTPPYGGYTPRRTTYGNEPPKERTPYSTYGGANTSSGYGAGSYTPGDYESTRPDFGNNSFGLGAADYSEGKKQGKIVCFGGIEETIMYGIKEIKDGAYSGRTDIISAELPESVKAIGKNAFSGCSRLESITIPTEVTAIGERAFNGCGKLAEISLPEATQQLGAGAFYGCKALKEVKIPANIKSIGADTFANCTSLESVRIPDGVTEIGERAFIECTGLKNIYFGGTQAQWKLVKIGAGNPKMGGFLAKIKVNFNA
jgi:hypothetical protein